jgi:cytochrome c peroxidase
MASATRTFARAALRASTRPALAAAPRSVFRQSGRRYYSSEPAKSGSSAWLWVLGAAAIGGGGFYLYSTQEGGSAVTKVFTPTKDDYQKVYNEIASRLEEKDDYDDGSYGPVLVRLAWHASGTYDKETGTGGSNGATMRFAPEGDHGANAGLKAARDFLEPVKRRWQSGPSGDPLGLVATRLLTDDNREVPLDHLLGSVDPGRCDCHPGDAGACDPVPPRPRRSRRLVLHS